MLNTGTGIFSGLYGLYFCTLTQSIFGSGQRSQAGHGGHLFKSGLFSSLHFNTWLGHLGQTGGTICDFNIYKSSLPTGIFERGIPSGNVS